MTEEKQPTEKEVESTETVEIERSETTTETPVEDPEEDK